MNFLKESIDDVHIVLDPIVDHLLLAVWSDDYQDRRFPILRRLADLYVRFLAVVENADGPDIVVAL